MAHSKGKRSRSIKPTKYGRWIQRILQWQKGFVYLTAVIDWTSHKVLAAKVAITLEACHA